MKKKITQWYKLGLWSAEMIEKAVKKGALSKADAAEILGKGV